MRKLLIIPFLAILAGCSPALTVELDVKKWQCTETVVAQWTEFVPTGKFTQEPRERKQRICSQWTRMEGVMEDIQ